MASAIAMKPPPTRSPRRNGKRSWVGWGFVAPFAIIFIVALVAPVIYAIYLSVFQQKMIGGTVFVGLDNFAAALTDPLFWAGFARVLVFFVVQVPIMLALSAFAALAIDSARVHFPSLFRIIFFLPYAVPGVVAALMWGFIYGKRFGLVNSFESFLGIELPDPLSSPWILAAIGNIAVWAFFGYNMLILYSALRVVPKELYEAAEIDGASTFQVIRAIKLPAMRPAFVVALVFSIIGSFQLFSEPQVLKPLAPNAIPSTFTPNMYTYNLAFTGYQVNYAAAIAIVMGVITVAVAYIAQVIGNRRDAS